MRADDGTGPSDDGGTKHFSRMGEGGGRGSDCDCNATEGASLAVEEDDVEGFLHGMNLQDVLHIIVHELRFVEDEIGDFEQGGFVKKFCFVHAHFFKRLTGSVVCATCT